MPAPTFEAAAETRARVAALVDHALARRIEEELSEAAHLSPEQRIAWISLALARRQSIVDNIVAMSERIAAQPDAPSFSSH